MIGIVKQIGTGILVAGFSLALLRMFGGDPLAIVEWVIEWVWASIERVADFFTGSEIFREATKKPSE